jgi:hypothetical protein
VAGGLTVGPEARIGGSLNYTSTREFTVPSGVVTGAVTRHEEPAEVEAARPISAGERALDWFLKNLRNLVTLLLVGLLLVWLAPDLVKRGADALQARPLPSLGWGFVSYLVVFAAALALIVAMILLALLFGFFTLGKLAGTVVVIGIVALAALILVFLIATSFISKIVVSCLGGHLILARVKPDWAGHRVWPVILGVVIFAILAAIPYLGWWINLIVILFGLGVLWLLGGQALQRRPTTA